MYPLDILLKGSLTLKHYNFLRYLLTFGFKNMNNFTNMNNCTKTLKFNVNKSTLVFFTEPCTALGWYQKSSPDTLDLVKVCCRKVHV